jgi:hypothetical protein
MKRKGSVGLRGRFQNFHSPEIPVFVCEWVPISGRVLWRNRVTVNYLWTSTLRVLRKLEQRLEEPQDTFYGNRRYGAEDPEGHQWYFAQDIKRRSSSKRG